MSLSNWQENYRWTLLEVMVVNYINVKTPSSFSLSVALIGNKLPLNDIVAKWFGRERGYSFRANYRWTQECREISRANGRGLFTSTERRSCWNAPMNSCRWMWGTRVIFFVGSLQHMSHKKGAKENNKHSKKLIDQQLRRSPLCPPTHCLKSFLVLSRWGFLVSWVGSWQRSSYTHWEAALQLVGWTS